MVFTVTITATFYAPTKAFPTPDTPDLIVPLSNLSPTLPNFFAVDNDAGAATVIEIPGTTEEAYVEIICSGNSAEEFWYLSKFMAKLYSIHRVNKSYQIHPTSSSTLSLLTQDLWGKDLFAKSKSWSMGSWQVLFGHMLSSTPVA